MIHACTEERERKIGHVQAVHAHVIIVVYTRMYVATEGHRTVEGGVWDRV